MGLKYLSRLVTHYPVILRPGPLAPVAPAGARRCGLSQVVKTAQ